MSRKSSVDSRARTVEFNEHINNRDLDRLAALMADDHVIIDTAGHAIHGKSTCLSLARIFDSFPNYQNVFDSLGVEGNRVVVVGHSICSDARLDGPALWVAKVSDGSWRNAEPMVLTLHVAGLRRRSRRAIA